MELPPEERARFIQNLSHWRDLSPEQRRNLRERQRERRRPR
jgi:hypothetical protein